MNKKIYIVGAGVSGLIAAYELEQAGYAPIIVEQSNTVGGRVCTQMIDGVPLDIGFQVVLSEYPAVKKYLDFATIPHVVFEPGAIVYKNAKGFTFGDPLRKISFLMPMLTAPIGTLLDKYKVFTLKNMLAKKTLQQIFEMPNIPTLQFLQEYGFSAKMINDFFKPFYTGIFLEAHLQTSSRMFCFVFALFGKGNALLPKNGMQSIAQHLLGKLKTTQVLLNHQVTNIDGNLLYVNHQVFKADAMIIATDPQHILPNTIITNTAYHTCTNLYFACNSNTINQHIIGLVADANALVNNISFIPDTSIISVTVVKPHQLSKQQLISQVKAELLNYCGISTTENIAVYTIQKALPICVAPIYQPSQQQIHLNDYTYLAGDYLANASMNASMLSGELAATCVKNYLAKA
jgi:protoporphyrinogen oxidase